MEDYEVRHLQQSFITLKIRIRLEIAESTQFAERKNEGIIASLEKTERSFFTAVPFPEQKAITMFRAGMLRFSGFQNRSRSVLEFLKAALRAGPPGWDVGSRPGDRPNR